MLLPHDRENLENAYSEVASTRIVTAICGSLTGFAIYNCVTANDIGHRFTLGFAVFVTAFFFFFHGSIFFEAHLTIFKLEVRSRLNERTFFKQLDMHREELIISRK